MSDGWKVGADIGFGAVALLLLIWSITRFLGQPRAREIGIAIEEAKPRLTCFWVMLTPQS